MHDVPRAEGDTALTPYEIRLFGDPVLKRVAEDVVDINGSFVDTCNRMLDAMYEAPGIGLAAPQVGIGKRFFVYDFGDGPGVLINPTITESDGEWEFEEGCLSIPKQYADVERPASVKVKYLDYDGKEAELEAEGLLSHCVQHEIDHLNGVLFVDYLSSLKRNMILRKVEKLKKMKITRDSP